MGGAIIAPPCLKTSLVKIIPSSLHSEWKSNDIQENPHSVGGLSCQRSLVFHGQISPHKSNFSLPT